MSFAPYYRFDGSISDSTVESDGGTLAGRVATSLWRAVVVSVQTPPALGASASPNELRDYALGENNTYCSVFVYSLGGASNGPHDNVLVTYPYSGLQEGDVMQPRGCTRQMSEITRGIGNQTLVPDDLDGDHVLIGFIDGELALPAIVAYLPHPRRDVGKTDSSTDAIGYRTVVRDGDGSPKFSKHQGIYTGVGKDGNYEANTTKAHKGVEGVRTAAEGGGYTATGEEVSSTEAPGGIATSGNYTVKLKQNAKLLIEFEGGSNSIQLTDNDGILNITTSSAVNINADSVDVGNSATEAAVLGTTYRAQESVLLSTVQTQLTALTAALTVLATLPTSTVPVTGAVLAGLLSGPVVAVNAAIGAFESSSSSYLSTKVDIG